VETVFDVPTDGVVITVGFFLAGEGKVWASWFEFAEVGRVTEVTPDLDLTASQHYDFTYARIRSASSSTRKRQRLPIVGLGK
jgi:hypothetical protein